MVMNQRGCCYVCGSSDNNNCVHFAHPLRPINQKLATNTAAMGVQPSQRHTTKAVSNSLRSIISDQSKIANIVLNPPFIKLDRRDIPLRLATSTTPVRRVPSSSQPDEEDPESSDDDDSDPDPDYKGRTRRRSKNENLPISQQTEITISQRARVVPTRQCKTAPSPGANVNNVVPLPRKKKNKFLNSTAKRKRLGRIGRATNKPKPLNNPSRASLRLFQQLKKAAGKAAQAKSRRRPTISTRTVELVNQTTERWREEKAKLMFMVALDLTPIPNRPAVILPSIKLDVIPTDVLDELKKKYEQAKAERLAKFKEERRLERLRRFEKIRNWRLKTSKAAAEAPVEVIDLASDDESKNETEALSLEPTAVYILPDEYPNLTIEVSSTSRSNTSSHHIRHKSPISGRFANQKPSSHNFAKPTVIKRIGYGNNMIAKRRLWPIMNTSFSQRQNQRSPSRSSRPQPSLPTSTVVRTVRGRRHSPMKSNVFSGPSPPMEITPDISIPNQYKTSSPETHSPSRFGVDPLSMVEIQMPDSMEDFDDVVVLDD